MSLIAISTHPMEMLHAPILPICKTCLPAAYQASILLPPRLPPPRPSTPTLPTRRRGR